MNQKLGSAMVICTRNRPADLRKCLASINLQDRQTDVTLVVDSSDSTDSELIVQKFASDGLIPGLQYRRAERGLTKQRNVALTLLTDEVEVVHFVDDDVEMEPGYVAELMAAFEADPDVVGAGGMVLGGNRRKPSLFAVLGGRDSFTPGRVLGTGFNVGAHETSTEVDTEWLPGCSMSFRVAAIAGLRFDEDRTGYAIGEDVDFGLRASSRGALRHVPTARLVHHQSPVNRHDRPALVRMAVAHRWTLAEDRLGRVKRGKVIYGALAESLNYFSKWVIRRDVLWRDCGTAGLKGISDALRRRGDIVGHQ